MLTNVSAMRLGSAVVALLLIAGCNGSTPVKDPLEREFPLIDGRVEPRLKTFVLAKDWVAFSRLPSADPAQYKYAAEYESLLINKYLFHTKSQRPLEDTDREQLAEMLSSNHVFRTWSGTKLCEGFNPGVAVRWTFQNREYFLLACFECNEVMVIGPEGPGVIYDMESPDELLKVLKPYI